MKFLNTDIKGVYIIDLEKLEDHRGFFARTYCDNEFANHGLETNWVQMNHSLTINKGTVRGLHFQRAPKTEIKLVRCIRGAVFDVILDIRRESKTYGEIFSVKLTSENHRMLYIPAGFAHGFQTIEQNTELLYMHSEFYSPNYEDGILYSDPDVKISWPLPISDTSARDQNHPQLKDIKPIDI